ncbi:MAG: hypothetical protein HXS54_01150 [Theionarchaea archaeon]|nr:hypothetical protein [Theionarchaea archaeon]
MRVYRVRDHRYYDLIQTPHGHTPAPLIPKIFYNLPIPAGKKRDNSFYSCPECGRPSFFKIKRWCSICNDKFYYGGNEELYEEYYKRCLKRQSLDRMRLKLKKIEVFLLPILIVFRLARYNRSEREKDNYDFSLAYSEILINTPEIVTDDSQTFLTEFMEVR